MFPNTSALVLFLLLCLLTLFRLSTARPTVEPPGDYFQVPKSPLSQGAWTLHNHERNARSLSLSARANSFQQRTPPSLTTPMVPVVFKTKLLTFSSTLLIEPIASAAKALEEFYSYIAFNAGSTWQTLPRRYQFNIEWGTFQLVFSSMGDTIPWDFVQEMAERLLTCARMGMSALFDAVYGDQAGQIGVAISLRLMGGVISGDSSGTDYREGSVPSVGSPYD